MTNPTIKVEGIEEIVAELQRRGGNVEAALEDICTAGAEVIADVLEATAPGSVGDEIVIDTTKKRKDNVEVVVGPSKEKWFARFFEYGTTAHKVTAKNAKALKLYGGADGLDYANSVEVEGVDARPFMRPALDGHQDEAQDAMRKETKKAAGI